MNSVRFDALNKLAAANNSVKDSIDFSSIEQFAQNVFNEVALKRSLNEQAYNEFSKANFKGLKIS